MINYIRKNNENKISNCSILASKKIERSFNFLKWSIRWSPVIQNGNHLVATMCFFVVPLIVQAQNHLVPTRSFDIRQQGTT